jgi:hypothetical protein
MKETLKEIVEKIISEGVRCNCDLDNWEPTKATGHSCVCRINRMAKERYKQGR